VLPVPRVPDGLTIRQLSCESTRTKGTAAHIPDIGKVEWSQSSDQEEFYQLLDYTDDVDLKRNLADWEKF
jgi:hypothetical protein